MNALGRGSRPEQALLLAPQGTESQNSSSTWFYFSVSGAAPGELLHITIGGLNKQKNLFSADFRPVFRSASATRWQRLKSLCTYAPDEESPEQHGGWQTMLLGMGAGTGLMRTMTPRIRLSHLRLQGRSGSHTRPRIPSPSTLRCPSPSPTQITCPCFASWTPASPRAGQAGRAPRSSRCRISDPRSSRRQSTSRSLPGPRCQPLPSPRTQKIMAPQQREMTAGRSPARRQQQHSTDPRSTHQPRWLPGATRRWAGQRAACLPPARALGKGSPTRAGKQGGSFDPTVPSATRRRNLTSTHPRLLARSLEGLRLDMITLTTAGSIPPPASPHGSRRRTHVRDARGDRAAVPGTQQATCQLAFGGPRHPPAALQARE